MNKNIIQFLSYIILCFFFLTTQNGCGIFPSGPAPTLASVDKLLTNNEIKLEEQSSKIINEYYMAKINPETVVGGVIVGATIGAAAGAVTGQSRFVAIGAGLGAAAGKVAGHYVAMKQQQYANNEARIGAMIADVHSDNQRIEQYITTVKDYIKETNQRLQIINDQYAKGQVTLEQKQNQLVKIRYHRDFIVLSIDTLKNKRNDYKHAAKEQSKITGQKSIAEFDKQILNLEKNIFHLEEQLNTLNASLILSGVG